MPHYLSSQGLQFLKETALSRTQWRPREVITPAPMFKEYAEAPKIALPRPTFPAVDLFEALIRRRSVRNYRKEPLNIEDLALLLFATQGVTARAGGYLLRTAPSAGALYPIETYLCVHQVDGLPCGLYHFAVGRFSLEELRLGPLASELTAACLGQSMCAKAAVVFIWTAIPRRTMSKYGSRGMRYVFMDVAHICQNLLLAATALGLGACPIGAFFDDELAAFLEVDGQEECPLYLATVGWPA